METSPSTSCLSFFTSNHVKHDKQWLQKGSQLTLVCFACFVEIIEDKNQPSIRKNRTLQELLNLIANEGFLKQLAENEVVLSHLLNCLWELTDFDENSLTLNSTVIEIIYQLCCSLKSESLVQKVVEKLSQKLLKAENIKKVSPHFDLLGKLLQEIPGLTGNLVRQRQNLVAYIGKSTSFPEEGIRSSLFYILTHFYRDKSASSSMPEEITEMVFRECCEVLTSAASKKLQINSIACLQSMTRPENLVKSSRTIKTHLEQVIISLKKAFLCRTDLVQSLAMGCLINMVAFDEQIINSDLTGFLFEVFKSKNEALLALAFQSVSQLIEKVSLYNKGHVVYGFETILSALIAVIRNRNTKLTKQGLGVFAKVFLNCPDELALVSSKNVFSKCLEVIGSGLSSLDNGVVLQASHCLGVFMARRHFSCNVQYRTLMALIETLVGKLRKICPNTGHLSRVENKDLKSSMIAAILEVIKKSLLFACCSKNEPPSLESLLASTQDEDRKELDQFVNKLLQLCDQVCIPTVICNLKEFHETAIPKKFFEILNQLLSMCPLESTEMSKKFVSSCFIRIALDVKAHYFRKTSSTDVQMSINYFLETVSCRLIPKDIKEAVKIILNSCLSKVNGTAQSLLEVLTQNTSQDETLRNTQECILVLYYLAYQNGDRMVTTSQLLHVLSTFLVLNPTCYEDSVIIPKCLTQLYITELSRSTDTFDESTLRRNAKRILADAISKYVNNPNVVYFNDLALVEWAIRVEDLNPEVRKQILELWFSLKAESDEDTQETKFWKRIVDGHPSTVLILASILSTGDTHAQNTVLSVLRKVIKACNTESENLKRNMKELKFILQNLFINQAVEPLGDGNLESVLNLLCYIVTSVPKITLDGDFMKLIYHVVNLLRSPGGTPKHCVACLNLLNASLIEDTNDGSDQVLSFLLRHCDYNKFLETATEAFQTMTELEISRKSNIVAAVLLSVSYLVRFQKIFGISSENVIKIKIELLLSLLCFTTNPLVQFAANLFWESILDTGQHFATNVSLQSENKSSSATEIPQQRLSNIHLEMIMVRLQNSLLHANPLIQLSALRCLEALLSFRNEAKDILQDPWNTALLREVKDFDSTDGVTILCLQLYSLFIYHKRKNGLVLDFPIKDLLQSTVEKFGEYEPGPDPNQDKMISTSAIFFGEIIQSCPDAMTTVDKSNLKCHVKHLIDSYHDNTVSKQMDTGSFVYIQEILVYNSVLHGKKNDPIQALEELLPLLN